METVEYSLIVVDVTLPKLDGVSFCRQLRQPGYRMSILLLMARNASINMVMGLDAGADDCIAKPFDPQELTARVRALLRWGSFPKLPPVLGWGSLRLDPSTCEVIYGGKTLSLTPKEYSLLEFFLRNCDRMLSRRARVDHLWKFDNPPEEDTVRSHVKGLRRKFKGSWGYC